jgi:tRNA/rRNA methyltransferase
MANNLINSSINSSIKLSFCVVLVETSLAENVGSVARAMKTMGFYELKLVQPKIPQVLQEPQAIALASSAQDLLQHATIYDSLAQAIADDQIVLGMSARKRECSPIIETPLSFCDMLQKLKQSQQQKASQHDDETIIKVALVFGNERVGLSNHDLLYCTHQGLIPCNAEYSSLNLAQAVQILCYQIRQYFEDDLIALSSSSSKILKKITKNEVNPPKTKLEKESIATSEQLQQLLNHWQQAMKHVDVVHEHNESRVVQRFQNLFHRQQLTLEEVQLFRGICHKILTLNKV